jgi:hypothetical protein
MPLLEKTSGGDVGGEPTANKSYRRGLLIEEISLGIQIISWLRGLATIYTELDSFGVCVRIHEPLSSNLCS